MRSVLQQAPQSACFHRSSNIASYDQRAPLPYKQEWGGFPLESIGASSNTPGATRIELGFLGAHADIGGGFEDRGAGVTMNDRPYDMHRDCGAARHE